jgi:hypothetical protein
MNLLRSIRDFLLILWTVLKGGKVNTPRPISTELFVRVPSGKSVPDVIRYTIVGAQGLRLMGVSRVNPNEVRLVGKGDAVDPYQWSDLWRHYTPGGGKGWTLEDGSPYEP